MGTPNPGRERAAELIWDWRGTPQDEPETTPPAAARLRGTLQAGVGGAASGLFFWLGWETAGTIVGCIAGVILLTALVSPTGLFAVLERAVLAVGQRIGRGLTWLLLVPLFYLFFAPFGRLFRRGHRDRMRRFFEPEAPTYWEPHEGPTAASTSHESQY